MGCYKSAFTFKRGALVATFFLSGCGHVSNPFTMNVMPTLTPEEVATKSAACSKNTTARPYPPEKPQVVFCDTKTVLPPGYVSPVPYVKVL